MSRGPLQRLAAAAGIDTHQFLTGIRERSALRILQRKRLLLDEKTRLMLAGEDERDHLADLRIEDRGLLFVIESFTIDRILFIRETLGEAAPVVDLGDSNGIFLRSLGRDGIGLNISVDAAKKIHGHGLDAVIADIEHLPFRTGSIPAVFLFETLEHVPNPIRVLNEIGRVCRGSLVLSIPFVEKTCIHPFHYDPSRPVHQHHIFEFSPADFDTILTHTPFELTRARKAVVLGGGGGFVERLVFFLWKRLMERDTFAGCFTHFYLCHCAKRD